MSRRVAGLLALVALLAATGCGGGSRPTLVVSAAASLKAALTRYAGEFAPARVRLSFGGSDLLAAQIRAGAQPDVFASANTVLPSSLHVAGLVESPVLFAANRLVLAVPARSQRVRSLSDLGRPGVSLAIGSATVPVGAYTRVVLARLGRAGGAILARARSQEPDVTGIVGKLEQGAADAGFLYVTDVRATHGALRTIELPAKLQPTVAYAAAVVASSRRKPDARAFIAGLLRGAGAAALRAAGFAPPPSVGR